ncbi:MAG: hypothetical protein QGE95_12670 [Arenicellales bacterium]|jgi:predicted  nucleic acid-binding Zn-ribbon protein|nr:hypothetical protein [Arenicellales bacterium]|tara:strand:- start:207 stop:1817 length:1611 start_codon:yes stop_codon:yes gene_type:complete
MAGPRFKPRIDDRNDKLAFGLAFGIGAIGILVVRMLGAGKPLSLFDFLAVVISVGVIIAYTIYILISTDRSSISLDRAGDNAYYLGLLFTLISLVYSLWKVSEIALAAGDGTGVVRSADRVLSLLPDFGLALSSTIAGIFARVIVQQFRNDPADIETQARQELGEAIRMLRASLLQAVSDMNITSRATNVAMTEVMDRTRKTIEETAEANIDLMSRLGQKVDELGNHFNAAMTEVTTRAGKTIEETAAANVELMSRLGQKVDEVANHFSDQIRPVSEGLKRLGDELGAAVSHMKEQSLALNMDGSSVQQGLESVATELGNLRQKMEETKEGCQSFSDELSALAGRFSNVIPEDIVTQLQSVGTDVLERQGRLVSQFGTLENDITQVSQNLGGVGDRVSRATEGVEQVGTANQNLTSQLEGAATQLEEGQRQVLSELNSLEEKIRRTSESLKQAPRTTVSSGPQVGVQGNTGVDQPSFQSKPISLLDAAIQSGYVDRVETVERNPTDRVSPLSENEKPEDEPDVPKPRRRFFGRLFR